VRCPDALLRVCELCETADAPSYDAEMLTPETLGLTFAAAPDPELARVAFSRVGDDPAGREALARPEITPVASRLLGFSRAAADFLVAHPDEVVALADVSARDRAALDAELAGDVDARGAGDGLRQFRRRATLRVAARDLADASLEDVVAEISAIADACLERAVREAAVGARVAVIGLGKLGGSELNYASDVDLLFLHEDVERDAAGRIVSRLIALLAEPTTHGVAFRVDPTLRPGGRGGDLSRTLSSTLAYYESGSATWERQAMIKARAVAGDPWLGAAFVQGVAPFVFPAELEPAAIDEVRHTKVRLEEYVRQRGKELTEVKRGRGGIRDIEFAVQLLQIVHGRRDARLREPNTLRALDALADEGFVSHPDAAELADAYRFLRRLEHRLQIVRDLQTHDLPADAHARTTIARSLGLADAGALQAEYERVTALVRTIHERLFYRPLLEAFAGPSGAAAEPGVDRVATEELLGGLGFASPHRSYEVLARLVDPRTRIGKVLANDFPVIAPALALSADPDAALVRLERIAEGVGDRHEPADALAADPGAARRLAHLAGASSFATDLLVARPDRLLALSPQTDEGVDPQGALVAAAARSVARELTPRETGEALTSVAERVIEDSLRAAGPDVPFAVIGMGKLGARELNIASDLDLMFVYEGEGPAALRRAGQLGEAVLRGVRGAGWEPDADLRPEGRNGPLARSIASYLEYWERYAELWEFQALLRARAIAGDPDLGRRFELNADDFAYPPDGLTRDRVVEIRHMRERIERERVKPPEAAKFHFKLGIGSLADVQFAVELSLMRFGGPHPQVRSRSTLEAIDRLAEARLLEGSVARDLGEAFVFCSDVKNALEVDRRLHAEAMPPGPEDQAALARRLGYEEYPRQTFIDDYLRITRRARRAMERVFVEAAS
jgi:[glutamine synthetase] adenylyltransferase / [glutamine synthetase]-adenylyl-L-tyrosine phosphorylase